MHEWPAEIECWLNEGKQVAIATVVRIGGSAPRSVGARMVLSDVQEIAGSVSGGCVESAVILEAMDVLESGKPRLRQFGISDDAAWDVGLACGGAIDVFIERVTPDTVEILGSLAPGEACELLLSGEGIGTRRRVNDDHGPSRHESRADGDVFIESVAPRRTLVMLGAVHVAQSLAMFARELGFSVVLIDPRKALATPDRFPETRIIHAWPADGFAQLTLDRRSVVVVLSHDPKLDEPAIVVGLRSPASYVGAIGSRRTTEERRGRLLDAGLTEEDIARLHAPIGLDIGGQTPAEMAISILAEIIAETNGRSGAALRDTSGHIRGTAT